MEIAIPTEGCWVYGCQARPVCRLSLCSTHFKKFKHLGLVGEAVECPTEDCEFFIAKAGLCLNCYEKAARKKPAKKAYERSFRKKYLTPERKEQHQNWKREHNRKIGYYQTPEYKAKKKVYYTSEHGRRLYAARAARRRARKLKATPRWADLKAIQAFYMNCPPGHHVDHIIPLQGKNVSGLHVLENLQYLPASQNVSKSNHFDFEEYKAKWLTPKTSAS